MPKIIAITLAWSHELQRYVLFDGSVPLDIVPESPAWFAWLDQITSFGFVCEQGRYTLRKEKKQRGAAYWYAYRGEGKQLTKKYVGKTTDLTPAQLKATIVRGDSSQAAPLLAPKLQIPRLPAKLVSRPRLLEQLEQQMSGPLTLISAQAGAGKTTLVAEWAASSSREVAWLSLEPADNQPTRFLSYVIAALQRLDPQIGVTSLPPLRSLQPPALETILVLFANEVAASSVQPITLVLDDYHALTAQAILNATAFLLDHLASHLHLIILTRSDPALPLSRLRARGQVLELRVHDLRFAQHEASEFLHNTTNCALSNEDVQLLTARTEGWAAGLQLAALSLRGTRDGSAFVRDFAGSNRFVLDYLSDEVLSHLPAPTLTFLLHTSVLTRLNASLCAALLEETGISEQECQQMLETLDRENLFISAFDDQRHYRYHALFASVLQAHLAKTDPARISLLHRRACAWFEQRGLVPEAIQHALALQDSARIAALLRGVVWEMFLQGEFDVLLGWLDALPASAKRAQPELAYFQATALAALGQADAAEMYLKQVENAREGEPESAVTAGEIAAVRVTIAMTKGDLEQARPAGQLALAALPEHHIYLRTAVLGSEAFIAAIDGDFRLALQYLMAAGQVSQQSENPFMLQRGMFALALFLMHLGQRSQVCAVCERGMHLTASRHEANLPYTGSLAIFLGIVLYENNQLEAARQHTQRGIELCEQLGETAFLPTGYALLAQIRYLEQVKVQRSAIPSQEVLALMQQAESYLWKQPQTRFWSMQHGAYLLVRLWMVQRNKEALARLEAFCPVDGASGAQEGSSYAAQTDTWGMSYIRFGQGQPEQVAAWLRWPIQAAEQAGRVLALMRMLILQARAHQELGQMEEAIGNIQRALQYAEPEGYSAMFLEMGQPMAHLLLSVLERTEPGTSQLFVQTLLRELGVEKAVAQPVQSAREFLTEREMEILRHIGAGLSNQDIARRMVVEVSTVKWHIRHIYEKLQVSNRTQAVLQAQARGLLL